MTRADVIAGYMLNDKHVIADMLYDTITKYESAKICDGCRFYHSSGNCLHDSECKRQCFDHYESKGDK